MLVEFVPSGSSRGESVSLLFPASRGCLYSLAHDFIPSFQRRQHNISCEPASVIPALSPTLSASLFPFEYSTAVFTANPP